jgi:hypothetical protein
MVLLSTRMDWRCVTHVSVLEIDDPEENVHAPHL